MKKNLLVYENLHIPFWLMKDCCWALQLKLLGIFMIFPTLTLSCLIVYKTRRNLTVTLPNVAITFWILANSLWMCDEFFNLDMRWISFIPFGLGLAIIGYWLVACFPKVWREN